MRLRFRVNWGTAVMSFEEVVGLDGETQRFTSVGNVTMKRGTFRSDQKFWDWFNQLKTNTTRRVPVTLSLMSETGTPTRSWTLKNAWPAKVTGPDLKATGNDVAIETIEIAHEGLS